MGSTCCSSSKNEAWQNLPREEQPKESNEESLDIKSADLARGNEDHAWLLEKSSDHTSVSAAGENEEECWERKCCSLRRCCAIGCLCVAVQAIALSICACAPVASQVPQELIASHLGGNPVISWNRSRPGPDVLEKARAKLNAIGPDGAGYQDSRGIGKLTFGTAEASTIAKLMFEATKDSGSWGSVPPKLRGVFWTRGNPVGQELIVLQHGTFFREEQTFVAPMVPLSWAWAKGVPKRAPLGGLLYRDWVQSSAALTATGGGGPGVAWSLAVKPCPSGRTCHEGSESGTFATLQAHRGGDLSQESTNAETLVGLPLGSLLGGHLELEEEEYSAQSGSFWKQSCWWGLGACRFFRFGSYHLVKILDGQGAPLEPGYQDFITYMGDVPLFVWSG